MDFINSENHAHVQFCNGVWIIYAKTTLDCIVSNTLWLDRKLDMNNTTQKYQCVGIPQYEKYFLWHSANLTIDHKHWRLTAGLAVPRNADYIWSKLSVHVIDKYGAGFSKEILVSY